MPYWVSPSREGYFSRQGYFFSEGSPLTCHRSTDITGTTSEAIRATALGAGPLPQYLHDATVDERRHTHILGHATHPRGGGRARAGLWEADHRRIIPKRRTPR